MNVPKSWIAHTANDVTADKLNVQTRGRRKITGCVICKSSRRINTSYYVMERKFYLFINKNYLNISVL